MIDIPEVHSLLPQGFEGLMMDKVNVNGKQASDIYNFLKVQSGETGAVKWNFTKVGRGI